jgi:Calcineurin-like phosphoesterase
MSLEPFGMRRGARSESGAPKPPLHRVAVIGDVAGHLDELRTELRRLGADDGTGRLPDDLTVVQLGDLIHRGPASDAVVDLVDGYLTDQPTQWVQLVGNHEAHYLRDPVFDWPDRISARSRDTLRRWWADGQMRAAAWVRDETRDGTESFLITHAGLTAGFWRTALAVTSSAEQAAITINSLIGVNDGALFRAGRMLHGRPRARSVGPVWAATATELLPSWLATTLPFSQIHGHDSIFDWQRRRFRAADEVARLTVVDEEAKHETTVLAGGRIIGIDPGHGSQPRRPWRAWEIRTKALRGRVPADL